MRIDRPRLAGQPLSERELDVLCLTARGLTNPRIAARLHLGVDTVKTHKRRLIAKLMAVNATNAVAIAMQLGYDLALVPREDA